jgi:hypothetical protein
VLTCQLRDKGKQLRSIANKKEELRMQKEGAVTVRKEVRMQNQKPLFFLIDPSTFFLGSI